MTPEQPLDEHTPQPAPKDDLTDKVSKALQEHDGWLRKTPNTSKEIAEHLFPAEDKSQAVDRDLILTITALMWDNGFTPSSWGKGHSRWYWREQPTQKTHEELAEVSR